jgi:hypothetical protein
MRGLIAAVGMVVGAERDGLAVLTSGLSRGVLAAERGASAKRRRRAKGAELAYQAARSATARSGDLAEPGVDPGWWELLPPTAAPPRSSQPRGRWAGAARTVRPDAGHPGELRPAGRCRRSPAGGALGSFGLHVVFLGNATAFLGALLLMVFVAHTPRLAANLEPTAEPGGREPSTP